MAYVASLRRPPRTLTVGEQTALLRASGKYREHFRDHVLFSLALGTALRESELAALNVGDVAERRGKSWRVLRRIALRVFKRSKDDDLAAQIVFVPDACAEKLARFLAWKADAGEELAAGSPLFSSGRRNRTGQPQRISDRTIRHVFRRWQQIAGFESLFSFHHLRHTSITNLYTATKDIRAAQRHARHARIDTTQIYTHVSDEALFSAVRALRS